MTPSDTTRSSASIAAISVTSILVFLLAVVGLAAIMERLPVPSGVKAAAAWVLEPFGQARSSVSSGSYQEIISESEAVVEAVKKASPAVVSIIATADVPKLQRCYTNPFQGDPAFPFEFRVPGVCEQGTESRQVGAGTGFLVSDDGYIVTNKHVADAYADGDETLAVILTGGEAEERIEAKVIATDPTNDIAILKIDRTSLPFLMFADSEAISVGQTAIAIGYALGQFENTVSRGVVSGLARSIVAGDQNSGRSEQLFGIIQTDAAINPGNSGGPLLDINGNVIGVNVAMQSAAQGIGFALPANDVRAVYESVRDTGKIQRPFLGIHYVPITPETKAQDQLSYDNGVLIVPGDEGEPAVIVGSPADKAGLQQGDIILEWNGTKIDVQHQLISLVSRAKIGDIVKLRIVHEGEEKDVEVTLAERTE